VNSKDKIDVIVRRMPHYGNKLWMHVKLKDGRDELVPSFEDWFRQIRALCYGDRITDPTAMPRAFFNRCFDEDLRDLSHEDAWAMLKDEFRFLR